MNYSQTSTCIVGETVIHNGKECEVAQILQRGLSRYQICVHPLFHGKPRKRTSINIGDDWRHKENRGK